MLNQTAPSTLTSVRRDEFRAALINLQNADGGWAFHLGGQSRVEPTSWAIRVSFETEADRSAPAFRKAAEFLRERQLGDGSWPASSEMREGSWITSITCAALQSDQESMKNVAAGLNWLCEDFPRDSSPWRRLMQRLRDDSHLNSQSDVYRGWGWTPRTSSWVEPTAFALMTLRDADPKALPARASQRREMAVALLYDRMCAGGGWNCGNPRVYGVDGEALVLPTCWALLALRDAPQRPGRPLSLAWLQKQFASIESAASLAVAQMTLENYGIEPPQAKRNLHDWAAQDLVEQGTHVLAWTYMAINPARRWPAVASSREAISPKGRA